MGEYVNLPRNYNFIHRLPFQFEMRILSKGNTIAEGTWYSIEIGEHKLNILSRADIKEGAVYLIQKRSNLILEIIKEIASPGQSPGQQNSSGWLV